MSLTQFIGLDDVRARLRPLRPKSSRVIPVPLKVGPRSKRFALVGIAFDYLLRIELQRLAPNAVARTLVAEDAVDRLSKMIKAGIIPSAVRAADGSVLPLPASQITDRIQENLSDAKAAIARHCELGMLEGSDVARVASVAIWLAKLDVSYRSGVFEPDNPSADELDKQDLIELLGIVPFDQLINYDTMLLNPTFGNASGYLGGADADLISGDLLIELKTTKRRELDGQWWDQLLAYFFLARRFREEEPAFPDIKRVGIYFCRHSLLLTASVDDWLGHPDFAEVERWFFERAETERAKQTAEFKSLRERLLSSRRS